MWEIIDNNGTIHSGNEEEMREAFDCIAYWNDIDEDDKPKYEKWHIESWDGDLKLIQIHAIEK